jgi:hypothetical protein
MQVSDSTVSETASRVRLLGWSGTRSPSSARTRSRSGPTGLRRLNREGRPEPDPAYLHVELRRVGRRSFLNGTHHVTGTSSR